MISESKFLGDSSLRRAVLVLVWMLNIALFFVLLFIARPAITFILTILSPFILALIVAYIFNPVVVLLQRKRRMGRVGAVVVTYSLILALAVGFFSILAPVIYVQFHDGMTTLSENLPRAFEQTVKHVNVVIPPQSVESLREILQGHKTVEAITDQAGPAAKALVSQTAKAVGFVAVTVIQGVALVVSLIALLVFIVLISFYFLLDYARLAVVSRVLIPGIYRDKVFRMWAEIDRALGGYLRGQFTICVIIGILYSIALMALGMRSYAILVGFLAGIGNLIPYFGPILGGVPTALWIIFGDFYPNVAAKVSALLVLLVFTGGVQALDGFILQPRIVGRSANLHPLLVLLALVVGAQFGLGGLVVAIPLAIMARVLVLELIWKPLKGEYDRTAVVPAGTDSTPVS